VIHSVDVATSPLLGNAYSDPSLKNFSTEKPRGREPLYSREKEGEIEVIIPVAKILGLPMVLITNIVTNEVSKQMCQVEYY